MYGLSGWRETLHEDRGFPRLAHMCVINQQVIIISSVEYSRRYIFGSFYWVVYIYVCISVEGGWDKDILYDTIEGGEHLVVGR